MRSFQPEVRLLGGARTGGTSGKSAGKSRTADTWRNWAPTDLMFEAMGCVAWGTVRTETRRLHVLRVWLSFSFTLDRPCTGERVDTPIWVSASLTSREISSNPDLWISHPNAEGVRAKTDSLSWRRECVKPLREVSEVSGGKGFLFFKFKFLVVKKHF